MMRSFLSEGYGIWCLSECNIPHNKAYLAVVVSQHDLPHAGIEQHMKRIQMDLLIRHNQRLCVFDTEQDNTCLYYALRYVCKTTCCFNRTCVAVIVWKIKSWWTGQHPCWATASLYRAAGTEHVRTGCGCCVFLGGVFFFYVCFFFNFLPPT